MPDKWSVIDAMVSELGDLYALEMEAANFPEISNNPALRHVHLTVVRAIEAMSRIGAEESDPLLQAARETLDSAVASAAAARRLLAAARAARNRRA